MNSHKNARLTRLGRVHLMQQIAHIGLEAAARQVGISKRRAYIWHKRWNEWGEAGLCDRSSRPASSPRQTKPDKRERVIQLRCNHRLIYTQIALRVGLSVATVGRICNQADIAKLPPAQALPPKCRYERQTPGEILHMDMKKLARFDRPGHRVTGNFNQFSRAPGYHALHVSIDDHSRVGFRKIFPDQTIQNVITFTLEALRYYRAIGVKVTGIMTDNGSAYRSKKFAKLLRRLKIRHLRTALILLAPMVRQSALSRRCCGNGLMLTVIQIQMPVPKNYPSGSNTTISIAFTRLSTSNPLLRVSVLK